MSLEARISHQVASLADYDLPNIASVTDSAHSHEYGKPSLGLVLAAGYPDRVPIAVRNLIQLFDEAAQSDFPVRISTVAVSNFGLSEAEFSPIAKVLDDHRAQDPNFSPITTTCERHSAARSFNVAIRELVQQEQLADYTMKIDDDARHWHGTLRDQLLHCISKDRHLSSPVYYRPAQDTSYVDDRSFESIIIDPGFRRLWPGGLSPNDWVPIPPYITEEGLMNIAPLLLGFDNSSAMSPTPITPIESGLTFSRPLVEALLATSDGEVFPEDGVGAEGLRLLSLLTQSNIVSRAGVVKMPIFDRPCVGGQPYEWGRSDAALLKALRAAQLLPKGIYACGIDADGGIYSTKADLDRTLFIRCVERLEEILAVLRSGSQRLAQFEIPDSIPLSVFRERIIGEASEAIRKVGEAPDENLAYWGNYERGHPAQRLDEHSLKLLIEYTVGVFSYCHEKNIPVPII